MGESALLKQHPNRHYPTVKYGKGVYLFDAEGREYLDGSSGAMTANIGHGVTEIAHALRTQAESVAFSYRTQFTNEPAEELARALADLAPGDLNWAYFVSSGSEATEFAMRAAISHWREKGRPEKVKVLSREVSYHGMTMGALSMSGHTGRRPDYGSLLHPLPVTPAVHWKRFGLPGESEAAYAQRAVQAFEDAIVRERPDTVAAVIVEPIVGAAGGVLMPPVGYLRMLREVCDRRDVLLIVDEVITGVGRTGDWFASAREEVVPDVLVIGKGMSAGYSPMAGVLLREHIVEAIRDGSGVSPFGHTFSGNPLSAATCLAVLRFIEGAGLIGNARARGEELGRGLRELAERHPRIADVRGRGLLWGFDITMGPGVGDAPPPSRETSAAFVEECLAQGLIAYPAGIAPHNNAVILSPPLVIDQAEVQDLLTRLARALAAMDERMARWVD